MRDTDGQEPSLCSPSPWLSELFITLLSASAPLHTEGGFRPRQRPVRTLVSCLFTGL